MQVKHIIPGGDLADAFKVRYIVFVDEQGFAAEIEVDDKDPTSYHVVVYDDSAIPAATARTFPYEPGSELFVIGRVAVLKEFRGTGLGLFVMEEAEKLARSQGAQQIKLGSQVQAAGFYEKCGYTESDERYMEEHCEHVTMYKKLGK